MAYEHLCMYCFKDLNGAATCPHCGKDSRAAVPQIQMLPGTLVYRDRFLVGRALGQDAGGIVYNAMDTRKGGVIRIREYLPRNCAERLNDGGVVPIAGMEDAFEAGMRKLRASVESVEDPRKRHFYFEENGTAYIAQRKNVKGTPMPDEDDFDDEDDRSRSHVGLYIAIAALIVVAIAVGIIWFLSSMSDPDDITITQPLATVSAEATWMPEETPTPTPYATATFAALVDPELSWMDYTYNGDVEKEYEEKQNSVQNTKKPTIITDEDYNTVSSSSSKAKVEELQERLAKLGWLNYYDVTGKYDSDTKQAVKDFQNYVNNYCSPAKKLTVDGIAGEKTQQWLYNSSVSLTKPTPTPEPIVTPKPDSAVIDANSPAREIRNLQRQLITLGLLPEGSADGEFGAATKQAVKKFQIRVNQVQGYDALDIDGVVDEMTQAFLDYYVEDWLSRKEEEEEKATPTPKPTETPEPDDGVIDADSSKEQIAFLQEQLVSLGLLDAWDVDGVYGRGTVSAVKQFQRWINEQRGVETLDVTGECDMLTQRYLEYCIENDLSPLQPTPIPTATPEPTEDPDESSNYVDASSPKESISFVQEMLATVGLLKDSDVDGDYGKKTTNAVKEFQRFVNDYYGEKRLEVTGVCDSSTLQFLEYAYSNEWNIGENNATPEPTDAPTNVPTATPEPEDEAGTVINADSEPRKVARVQQMLAGIRLLDSADVDGDYGKKTTNAVKALQQFVNEQRGAEILEITGECDVLTMQYLQYCYDNGWDVGSAVKPSEPDPTEPPYEEPDYPDEPDMPTASEIKGFTVEVDGYENDGQLIELTSGKHSIRWSARSGVESFHVYLYDGDGDLINSKSVSGDGELTVKASDLAEGEVYTLRIGALPENGGEDDIVWQTVQLTRYVPAEEPDDEPTREPEPEVSKISKPSISIGSSAYQEDGVTYISGDTVIFSWMSDGDVEYYNATLIYEDGTDYSLGNTTDTSKTVSAEQLIPGLWKLRIGAMPVGGSEDDMKWNDMIFGVPEPEQNEPDEPEYTPDEDEDEPTVGGDEIIEYIDKDSAPEQILLVQMALYEHGLINPDDITEGKLDELTLEAVLQFQMLVNEFYGIELELIDLESDEPIFIDQYTLDCLLYRELDLNS